MKSSRIKLTVFAILTCITLGSIIFPPPAHAATVDTLVDLTKLSSDFVYDLKYSTSDNFTGTKQYSGSICCLQEETAWKLIKANEEVMRRGLRIKIWDAYRPFSVQRAMWRVMPDSRFLADPNKKGSNHNKGAAVDITLVDEKGHEVEMPSGFDDFSGKAARSNPNMSPAAKENLGILTDAMVKSGFKSISNEWWHYDDADNSKYGLLDVELEDVRDRSLAVENVIGIGDSSQVILVTPVSYSASHAKLRLYEKKNGIWMKTSPDMQAYIGKNGFKPVKDAPLAAAEKRKYKYEGDGATPAGVFSITSLFGWGNNPGFKLPYKKTTSDDYFVSSNKKEDYNVFITRKGGPSKSWTLYEKLKIPDYKYGAVINYNNGPDRITGNGSAIFLHIADDRGYTSGCVSLSEANLLKIFKWLKPEQSPMISLGKI